MWNNLAKQSDLGKDFEWAYSTVSEQSNIALFRGAAKTFDKGMYITLQTDISSFIVKHEPYGHTDAELFFCLFEGGCSEHERREWCLSGNCKHTIEKLKRLHRELFFPQLKIYTRMCGKWVPLYCLINNSWPMKDITCILFCFPQCVKMIFVPHMMRMLRLSKSPYY